MKGIRKIVKLTRKMGSPKKNWLGPVMEQCKEVGLKKSDANNRSRWRLGVNNIYGMMR